MEQEEEETITVSGVCFETYPCRHKVTITTSKGTITKTMAGDDILKLIENRPGNEATKKHLQYLKRR